MQKRTSGTLFARLRTDTRGNALTLMAFALLPLMGAIGCGVDYARASMVRSKLQQAVDAAALAGRRAMTGDDITTAQPDVASYLAFNFPNGLYGSTPVTSNVTKPSVGEVQVVANTTVPTSIMAIFGIKALPISASGIATQTFENVDILLVLDTTGSMADTISGTTKLTALKQAVDALYTQLAPAQKQLTAQNLRMRIGILPYAATVNVGKIVTDKSPSYIQSANVPYYQWHATKTKTSKGKTKSSWAFGSQTYNLASFAASINGSGTLGDIDGNGDFSTAQWAGCIEERQTDNTITGTDSRTGAPASAYDLDIDMVPSGNANTQWKPYIYDVSNATSANGGGPNTNCPAAATSLTIMSQSDLDGKLAQLVARGTTYHDIGMIWGTRMLSNGGIFGGDNPDMWNQQKVRRYIIYMTDGTINTPIDDCSNSQCNAKADHSADYSAYGIEAYDKRVGGTSDTDNNARHTKRFLMACNAAKAKAVSVWTIAFGTGRVTSLDQCATSIDQSAIAASSQDLIDTFTQIGKAIGPLRIAH